MDLLNQWLDMMMTVSAPDRHRLLELVGEYFPLPETMTEDTHVLSARK